MIYIYTILHTYIICKEYKIYIQIYVLFLHCYGNEENTKWRREEKYYDITMRIYVLSILITGLPLDKREATRRRWKLSNNNKVLIKIHPHATFSIWRVRYRKTRRNYEAKFAISQAPIRARVWLLSFVFSCRSRRVAGWKFRLICAKYPQRVPRRFVPS